MKIRYAQILRSLSQELLQRIHHGQTIVENLEDTTDLNDVKLKFIGILFSFFILVRNSHRSIYARMC